MSHSATHVPLALQHTLTQTLHGGPLYSDSLPQVVHTQHTEHHGGRQAKGTLLGHSLTLQVQVITNNNP